MTTVTEFYAEKAKTRMPDMYYCDVQQLNLHIFLGCMLNVDPSQQPGR